MQKKPLRRFQGMLLSIAVLMMFLITACAGTNTTTGQPPPATTATTTSATQVPPTATQAPTLTPSPVAFKAGGISFIGPVKSITSSSLVMSAPNGQIFTMAITPQTDRSAFGGNLPAVGTTVDMDSAASPNGSFMATILKPSRPGDPDLNAITYTGITTSAVGTDRVIHFTVSVKNYTYTIPTTAFLSDFGGNPQAIGNNVSVKVKVQYPANTVVSVGNSNA